MTLHPAQQRLPIRFTPIDTAIFTVNSGLAGYVDTDLSATTGTDTTKLWVIAVFKNGAGTVAARKHGEAANPAVTSNNSVTLFSYVDSAGHMDLYRDPALNTDYDLIGYIK